MNFYGSQAAQAPARRPEPGPGEQPCPPPRPAAHSGRSCKKNSRNIKYININIKNIDFYIDIYNFHAIVKNREEALMKKVISRCPVCGGELAVARHRSDSCDTVIETTYAHSKLD